MRVSLSVLAVLIAGACGGSSPVSPTTEFIAFKAVSPSDGTAVKAGSTVTVSVSVTATLVNFNNGRVVMIVQDQVGRVVQQTGRPQPQATISKGTATVELSDSITVPDAALAVEVIMALFVEGSDRTAAFVKARYPVQ